MHWSKLSRQNFMAFKLNLKMLYGWKKIVKVRHDSKYGSESQEVLFDKSFIVFWINEFVLKPLNCQSIEELATMYNEIKNEAEETTEVNENA